MSKARANAETLRTALVAGDVTNANFTGADLELGKGGTGASTAGAARTALGVAIGSDVLAPDGSAANLTNLPAGGAEDFIASGTLPNGKPVILKANGQVEVVSETSTPVSQSIPAGSAVTFNAGTTIHTATAYDPNTAGRFIVAYQNASNNYGQASVGTVSGNSISFGTAVSFNSGNTTFVGIAFDPDSANKFVIMYSNGAGSNTGKAVVGTVSGTTMSLGTAVVFNNAETTEVSISLNSENKYILCYRDYGNSQRGMAIVGTVSGTSISFGSEATITAGTATSTSVTCDPNTANKFVVFSRDSGVSNYGIARVGTVSGTSISFGTSVTFNSDVTTYISGAFDPNTANKCVVAYQDTGNSSRGTVCLGTVSNTSISFGSEVIFNVEQSHHVSMAFDPSTTGKFVVNYMDVGNGYKGYSSLGTLSGSSISFLTSVPFTAAAVGDINFTSTAFDPNTAGKYVVSYRIGSGGGYYGTAVLGQIASSVITTNLTASNFLGTSTTAYTNGQTAKIMLQGGVSTNQSSLAIGSTYYVQPTGTLATSAGTPSVIAGKAVKATTLLLKGI